MNLNAAFRLKQFIMPVFITVFLIAGCSDLLLQSEREPAGLEPNRTVTILGDDFKLGISVVDRNGVPFKTIPGWVDTTYTSVAENVLKIIDNGSDVVAKKTGVAQLSVAIAGISESIEVRVTPRFYLTQSVQRLNRSLPLITGRPAVVRLFLYRQEAADVDGDVTVKLYQNGLFTKKVEYSQVTLNRINKTVWVADLLIPGKLIEPGLSITVTTEDGVVFPENGSPFQLDVLPLPEFHIRLIPIHVSKTGQTGDVNKSNLKEYLEELLDMFPVDKYDVDLHPPVTVTDSTLNRREFYQSVLQKVRKVWIAEGKPDYYYYGVIPQSTGGIVGLGYVSNLSKGIFARQAVGWDRMPGAAEALAHEVGHNMGRLHAPCGGIENPDPNYPYPNASIGTYGFEVDESQLKSPLVYKSFMSYCRPTWISDYTYQALVNFRMAVNSNPDINDKAQDVLLVSGRMSSSHKLILKPAFRITAPPTLPESSGPYILSGYDSAGNKLFSISFAGYRFSGRANGARGFTFAIPIDRVHINKLAKLKLSGTGRVAFQRASVSAGFAQPRQLSANISVEATGHEEVSIQWDADKYKMALVKNTRTGKVIGFIDEGLTDFETDASRLKLFFSDGVHTTVKEVSI